MGESVSKDQKYIYDYLKSLLRRNYFNVPNKRSIELLIYVKKNFPNVDPDSTLSETLWDQNGLKFFDDAFPYFQLFSVQLQI